MRRTVLLPLLTFAVGVGFGSPLLWRLLPSHPTLFWSLPNLAGGTLSDSVLLVRFGAHEPAALPLVVSGRLNGQEPSFGLRELSDVVHEALSVRQVARVLPRREDTPGAFRLPGRYVRLELVLLPDNRVESRVIVSCPPATPFVQTGGPSIGFDRLLDVSSIVARPVDAVLELVQRGLTQSARARCPAPQPLNVTDDVDTIQVARTQLLLRVGEVVGLGDGLEPQLRLASGKPIHRAINYVVQDSSVVGISLLGLEGLRPGRTLLTLRPTYLTGGEPQRGNARTEVEVVVR